MADDEKDGMEKVGEHGIFADIDVKRIEALVELASNAQDKMSKDKPGEEIVWLKEKLLDFRADEIAIAMFIAINATTGGDGHPAKACMRAIIHNINARRVKKYLGEMMEEFRKKIEEADGGDGDGQ